MPSWSTSSLTGSLITVSVGWGMGTGVCKTIWRRYVCPGTLSCKTACTSYSRQDVVPAVCVAASAQSHRSAAGSLGRQRVKQRGKGSRD